MKQLQYLNLSAANFDGIVPHNIGNLSSLRTLDLNNVLAGGALLIDDLMWASNLSFLERLDMSYIDLSQTKNLIKHLDLSKNSFDGEFPCFLQNMTLLRVLGLSGNRYNSSDTHRLRLRKLVHLNLGLFKSLPGCWIDKLESLSLRVNKFYGNLPEELGELKQLNLLYLSYNMFNGSIPRSLGKLSVFTKLDISHNTFTGPIPWSLGKLSALTELDFSYNKLSGNLSYCWENFPNLYAMRLSSNELSGIIPNSIGTAISLQWLHLNNNSLTGQLPYSLKDCTQLELLDVGETKLTGTLPEWKENYLPGLHILKLRNNEFYGGIPSALCQMSKLQIIDLANNKLTGQIPHCFGNFLGMIKGGQTNDEMEWLYERMGQVINGVEQELTTTLVYVVNLDLSNNNLVGEIPSELTKLSALIGLNLSNNRLGGKIPVNVGGLDLSGKIPTGNQLQTLEDPPIYDGNPELCGAPLLKKCRNDKASNDENNHAATREGDRAEKIHLYGVIISGFATGFWGFIGVLIFEKSWRQAYFRFIEVVDAKMLGW
ncbi:hypothetical protein BUALT_Bualt06G0138200 [Buddleja alternifolia]|uniref:Uncharacterized protein n=1 Tax=Buddleja alternifolia TaxID=168488 RepID=A0AAV6XF15_9LAMI|nr:hypothetical protein BUALT_Bualt06G0138200 [Buddleja alternifolia]